MKFIKYFLYTVITVILLPIILFMFLAILAQFFPNHTYHYYEFHTPRKELDIGRISVRFMPSYTTIKNDSPRITEYGNPYAFLIFFKPKNSSKILYVKDVKMKYSNSGLEIKIDKENVSKPSQTYIHYKNIKLEHKAVSVELKILFEVNGEEILKEIKFDIKPCEYRKKRSNDFFDMVMSA